MMMLSGSSSAEDLLLVGHHPLADSEVPGSSLVVAPVAMMQLSNVIVSSAVAHLQRVGVEEGAAAVVLGDPFFFIR